MTLLDFVLDGCAQDERPYLNISILGRRVLGLLDTGASRTILGLTGWKLIRGMGFKLRSVVGSIRVANGEVCDSKGVVTVPVEIKGRTRLVEMLVVPALPQTLILGVDFFKALGVVPDLRGNTWTFSGETVGSLDVVKSEVSVERERRLGILVAEFKAKMGNKLGCTQLASHVIKTSSPPIKQRYYPVSPVIQRHINQELDEMLALGVVEPSDSGWSSPVLLVKKKDQSYRFCVDFRRLNAVTERDGYPLPYVSATLDKLKSARFLSSLDIKSAFWQVPVDPASRQYTAFTVPGRGLFQFVRMPFGLHNSPATWQRLMDKVIGADLEPHVFVYLDDVVIVSDDFDEHLRVLAEVFRRIVAAGLSLSWDKCQFCRSELRYLGYVVNGEGLHVDPQKVEAMLRLPVPQSQKEVRRVVGTFSWYRRFISGFSELMSPLTALLKKGAKIVWTEECDRAFTTIKERLVSAPILRCPDYSLPFELHTDASGVGLGAVLLQRDGDGVEHVVSFLSRSLSFAERNYSATERECLAVLWSVEKLRPYLEGVPFTVYTDHYSLLWLLRLKEPKGRIARWAIRLQQFEFEVKHRKGSENIVPDMLSRSVDTVEVVEETGVDSSFADSTDKWYASLRRKIEGSPRKYPQFRVENGIILKNVWVRNSEGGSHRWRLVVPKDFRREVMSRAHDLPTAGHMGVYKTCGRLNERYVWPGMRTDVRRYILSCATCSAYKVPAHKPMGQFVVQPTCSKPWQMMSVDLVGPLPRSKAGNQYILVASDYFSKFVSAFPLRSATAVRIVKLLEEEVFLKYGVPETLICDNGPQFRSRQLSALLESYRVRVRYNANYHPQANPVERVNRTLKTMVSIYCGQDQSSWDVNLPKIVCAINTARHEVTRLSPFFVCTGRNMILDGAHHGDIPGLEVDEPSDEKLRGIFSAVRERIRAAALRSKRVYDLRKRPDKFAVGQRVWKRNYVLSDAAKHFSAKLAPKYVGPFVVSRVLSSWTYELSDELGRSAGVWHAKDLKPHR